jgi:thiol-disulfide isomerase/thioredoxin
MRRFLQIFLICCMPAGAIYAQGSLFQIKGTISNMPYAEKVSISYLAADGTRLKDTAMITEGRYSFTGALYEPQDVVLRALFFKEKRSFQNRGLGGKKNRDEIHLYLSPTTIKLNSADSLSGVSIEGATWQKDFVYLKGFMDERTIKISKLNKIMMDLQSKNDTAAMEKLKVDANSELPSLMKDVYLKYAQTHSNSPLSIYALMLCKNLSALVDMHAVQKAFNALDTDIKALPSAKAIGSDIDLAMKVDYGSSAPDFSLDDVSGKKISLSSFKGKYVFVDFWASWCHPCRDETPYIKKAYDKYKAMGFEIFSITSPKEKGFAEWTGAIKQDGMNWTNVWDKKGDVSEKYRITGLPTNFLIDKGGKIIAKDLRGPELENKLKEIFGK